MIYTASGEPVRRRIGFQAGISIDKQSPRQPTTDCIATAEIRVSGDEQENSEIEPEESPNELRL